MRICRSICLGGAVVATLCAIVQAIEVSNNMMGIAAWCYLSVATLTSDEGGPQLYDELQKNLFPYYGSLTNNMKNSCNAGVNAARIKHGSSSQVAVNARTISRYISNVATLYTENLTTHLLQNAPVRALALNNWAGTEGTTSYTRMNKHTGTVVWCFAAARSFDDDQPGQNAGSQQESRRKVIRDMWQQQLKGLNRTITVGTGESLLTSYYGYTKWNTNYEKACNEGVNAFWDFYYGKFSSNNFPIAQSAVLMLRSFAAIQAAQNDPTGILFASSHAGPGSSGVQAAGTESSHRVVAQATNLGKVASYVTNPNFVGTV